MFHYILNSFKVSKRFYTPPPHISAPLEPFNTAYLEGNYPPLQFNTVSLKNFKNETISLAIKINAFLNTYGDQFPHCCSSSMYRKLTFIN